MIPAATIKLAKREIQQVLKRHRLAWVDVLPDKTQAWFWSKEWQKKESVADRDVAQGRMSVPYSDAKSLRAALKKLK